MKGWQGDTALNIRKRCYTAPGKVTRDPRVEVKSENFVNIHVGDSQCFLGAP